MNYLLTHAKGFQTTTYPVTSDMPLKDEDLPAVMDLLGIPYAPEEGERLFLVEAKIHQVPQMLRLGIFDASEDDPGTELGNFLIAFRDAFAGDWRSSNQGEVLRCARRFIPELEQFEKVDVSFDEETGKWYVFCEGNCLYHIRLPDEYRERLLYPQYF